MGSNHRPIGYASHYHFHDPFQVCKLDYPLILLENYCETSCTCNRKHNKGSLPSSLYTFLCSRQICRNKSLARDYHSVATAGFPEFDRLSLKNHFSNSPVRIKEKRITLRFMRVKPTALTAELQAHISKSRVTEARLS